MDPRMRIELALTLVRAAMRLLDPHENYNAWCDLKLAENDLEMQMTELEIRSEAPHA
jgi:hypothetical protein